MKVIDTYICNIETLYLKTDTRKLSQYFDFNLLWCKNICKAKKIDPFKL
jgi:hypothetical protein